jgi:CubicO group peptidase (beta-lactamase class C family)
LRFPAQGAQLRGRADAKGQLQDAFWIQPGDQGQDLASPIVMQALGHETWRGRAAALDLRFTLYANIFRREDGLLIVAFRNPQRNTRGGGSRLFVEQKGFSISFLDNNEGKPGIRHDGTIAIDGSSITMPWAETGATITLHRATPVEEAAYYPRGKARSPYVYARPAQLNDGWQAATARDTGIDEARLAGAVQKVIDVDPSGRKPDLVHAMIVAHNGRLVLEEYFYGQKRTDLHDLRSAGKTLSSVMLGTLMRDGTISDANTPVMPILRTRFEVANPSAAKDAITLAHLMTHMSGLACDDNDEHSPGGEDTMQGQPSANWWKYIADLPVVTAPGTRYAYCSGGVNLVGAALTMKSGLWLPMLFDRDIARPLRFGPYAWNLSPDGEGYMGGGARMAPRDLLKIGQLYLNRGTWDGRRIVPEAWVDHSTSPKVVINEQSTGLDAQAFQNSYVGGSDGYAWHIFDITAAGRTWRSYEAAGNGGQMVVVVPELSLAVAMTGWNYNQGFIWGRWRDDIIGGHIIPAIVHP